MRKLTVTERINDHSLGMIEKIAGEKFSEDFKIFMKANAGLNHEECIYKDTKGTNWEVNSYFVFKDIYKLTDEFIKKLNRKMVPFAFDPGGWHFCLCMEQNDFGAIYINRWTDHLPEEQFLKIANSFEEFINGLKREDE